MSESEFARIFRIYRMWKVFPIICFLILTTIFSCADFERENPLDPKCKGPKCNTLASSSSGDVGSSSSDGVSSSLSSILEDASSSSGEQDSSSSEEALSSGGEQGSSSSEGAMSSSEGSSSSSEALTSSSSGEQGSSSSAESSSSIELSSSSEELCDDTPTDIEFCHNGQIVLRCGGTTTYNPETENCCGDGSNKYNIETQFCLGNSPYTKCGGKTYDPSTQRCWSNAVETKCGTNIWYDATNTNLNCVNDIVKTKCGNGWYVPATQFCYNGSEVGDKCGINPQTYNPTSYQCKPDVNSNGIFLKELVSYEDENYEAVLIGGQVWLARNLNYAATNSTCGNVSTNQLTYVAADCDKYGRLYKWSTAMGIDEKYNNEPWKGDDTRHKGVCPDGWHLPSNTEWTALAIFAGGTDTNGDKGLAGTKLKATSDWSGAGLIPGTDDYGFSALPGGTGANGYLSGASNFSSWWSASEFFSDICDETNYNDLSGFCDQAYYRSIRSSEEKISYTYSARSVWYRVRCVKDTD